MKVYYNTRMPTSGLAHSATAGVFSLNLRDGPEESASLTDPGISCALLIHICRSMQMTFSPGDGDPNTAATQ